MYNTTTGIILWGLIKRNTKKRIYKNKTSLSPCLNNSDSHQLLIFATHTFRTEVQPVSNTGIEKPGETNQPTNQHTFRALSKIPHNTSINIQWISPLDIRKQQITAGHNDVNYDDHDQTTANNRFYSAEARRATDTPTSAQLFFFRSVFGAQLFYNKNRTSNSRKKK